MNNLIATYPEIFEYSIRYTTRMPKKGEIHGVHYFFV